ADDFVPGEPEPLSPGRADGEAVVVDGHGDAPGGGGEVGRAERDAERAAHERDGGEPEDRRHHGDRAADADRAPREAAVARAKRKRLWGHPTGFPPLRVFSILVPRSARTTWTENRSLVVGHRRAT